MCSAAYTGGVRRDVDGGVALDDFLCARPRLSQYTPLADMVALLFDVWTEDGMLGE